VLEARPLGGEYCHEGDIVKSTRRACRGFGIRLLCSLLLGGGPRGRRTQADRYRGDQIVQDLGRDAFRSLLRRNSSPNLGRGGMGGGLVLCASVQTCFQLDGN